MSQANETARPEFDRAKRPEIQPVVQEYARRLGWTVVDRETPGGEVKFRKGDTAVWLCRQGWASARLVDHHWTAHRYYDSLLDALEGKNGQTDRIY